MSLIGRTLSHYQILDEISRGGMGVVYRAVDTSLSREVALKVLPAELVADPARRARFVQEARAASSLEHPHIAVIHEIDEVDGVSFIAMELVRGDKLSDALSHGRLAAGRAIEVATEVAEGLARIPTRAIRECATSSWTCAPRRHLESGAVAAVGSPRKKRSASRAAALMATGAALLVAVAAGFWLMGGPAKSGEPAGQKPSLAVMYFENNTGNAGSTG